MTISKRGRWLSQLFLALSLAASPAFSAPESEPLTEGAGPAVDATPKTLSPVALPSSSADQTAEAMPADAATAQQPDEPEQPLAVQIESLKKQLIKLNRDLFILEEELLFPANTQLSVLLAFDADDTFSLDSVKLKIDDEVVTQYLYTDRQIHALQRGGVQRLYMGNLRAGEHELTAVFIGFGPNKREYKRAATLTFNKETGQKTIEVKISASEGSYQPEFSVIES
ncbi:MAG: Miff domain-containing protein [Pseudomonadales bacterium]|nr:Miff domain-containing protein [Pseudomonadales bacterium]